MAYQSAAEPAAWPVAGSRWLAGSTRITLPLRRSWQAIGARLVGAVRMLDGASITMARWEQYTWATAGEPLCRARASATTAAREP